MPLEMRRARSLRVTDLQGFRERQEPLVQKVKYDLGHQREKKKMTTRAPTGADHVQQYSL